MTRPPASVPWVPCTSRTDRQWTCVYRARWWLATADRWWLATTPVHARAVCGVHAREYQYVRPMWPLRTLDPNADRAVAEGVFV